MSQHLAAKYMREHRKRAKIVQSGTFQKKRPKTDAERAQCYRDRKRTTDDTVNGATDWNAGEGTSRQGMIWCLFQTILR